MLALDQRESLRTMLVPRFRGPVPDRALIDFKLAAARTLTRAASAVLLDLDYGGDALEAIVRGCGLIVAADLLTQEAGGPVEGTAFDARPFDDPRVLRADAFKLLVIWRPDDRREHAARETTVGVFVDACRRRGRAAIVEGIVREPAGTAFDPDRHADRVLQAAVELAALGPDLYKAEVPTLGSADDATIEGHARRISAALPCPWVVLSNGTPADRFGTAMLAACRGGASGFLAGRAIWTASLAAADVEAHLAEVAAPRLVALAEAVDGAVATGARR
jgi:sulfofructosephosphate aldolase